MHYLERVKFARFHHSIVPVLFECLLPCSVWVNIFFVWDDFVNSSELDTDNAATDLFLNASLDPARSATRCFDNTKWSSVLVFVVFTLSDRFFTEFGSANKLSILNGHFFFTFTASAEAISSLLLIELIPTGMFVLFSSSLILFSFNVNVFSVFSILVLVNIRFFSSSFFSLSSCFFLFFSSLSCSLRLISSSSSGTPLQVWGWALCAGRPGPLRVCSFFRHLARRFWNHTWKHKINSFTVTGYTFKEDNFVKLLFPSKTGSSLKGKNWLPWKQVHSF